MSSEDKSIDRRREYAKYISLRKINKGKLTEDALKALSNAFDVTVDDIKKLANDITIDSPMDVRMARFMLLNEDLRDYRDVKQINSSRSDIIKSLISDYDNGYEEYLFLG